MHFIEEEIEGVQQCDCRRARSRPHAKTTRSPETGGDTGLSKLMDFPHFKLSAFFAGTDVANNAQPLTLAGRNARKVSHLAILFIGAACLWVFDELDAAREHGCHLCYADKFQAEELGMQRLWRVPESILAAFASGGAISNRAHPCRSQGGIACCRAVRALG